MIYYLVIIYLFQINCNFGSAQNFQTRALASMQLFAGLAVNTFHAPYCFCILTVYQSGLPKVRTLLISIQGGAAGKNELMDMSGAFQAP